MVEKDYNEFSISSGHGLIGKETSKRISKPAANAIGQELSEFGLDVSNRAIEIANEKGRKTVRAEDIKDAARELK